MKILLIGHSIVDHFEGGDSKVSYPGGIFYSTLGVLSLSNKRDKIYLVTGYNPKSFHLFEKIYSKVELGFASKIDEMPEVFLHLYDDKEREENYKNLSSQLTLDKIEGWNEFDGVIVNMITGYDISLEQLSWIRKQFNGLIYFDVHTLSRGVDKNLKRQFRTIPDAEKWLNNIDILQVNENELMSLKEASYDEVINFVFDRGVKILLITKSAAGAEAYFILNDEIKKIFMPGKKVKAVNSVGCGDIFGAVFFYSYLCGKSIDESLRLAVKYGGLAVSKSINDKHNLVK